MTRLGYQIPNFTYPDTKPAEIFGKVVAQDEASYRYLAESIRRFPIQSKFETMIKDAGFTQVKHRNMSGGVVALHGGVKA